MYYRGLPSTQVSYVINLFFSQSLSDHGYSYILEPFYIGFSALLLFWGIHWNIMFIMSIIILFIITTLNNSGLGPLYTIPLLLKVMLIFPSKFWSTQISLSCRLICLKILPLLVLLMWSFQFSCCNLIYSIISSLYPESLYFLLLNPKNDHKNIIYAAYTFCKSLIYSSFFAFLFILFIFLFMFFL